MTFLWRGKRTLSVPILGKRVIIYKWGARLVDYRPKKGVEYE